MSSSLPYYPQYSTNVYGNYPPPAYESSYPKSHAMSQSVSNSSSSSYGSPPSSQGTYHSNSPGPYDNNSPVFSQHDWQALSNAEQLAQIEVRYAEPVGTHKKGQKNRSGSTSSSHNAPNNPAIYPCLKHGCEYKTSRLHDLKRHTNGHSKQKTYPCTYRWCARDTKPFTRLDHLNVHLRNVHMQKIPKRENGRSHKGGEDSGAESS